MHFALKRRKAIKSENYFLDLKKIVFFAQNWFFCAKNTLKILHPFLKTRKTSGFTTTNYRGLGKGFWRNCCVFEEI